MLYLNLFADGGALLECEPQGDASFPIDLSGHEHLVAELLTTPEAAAALARLYLAGVVAGERAARTMLPAAK